MCLLPNTSLTQQTLKFECWRIKGFNFAFTLDDMKFLNFKLMCFLYNNVIQMQQPARIA